MPQRLLLIAEKENENPLNQTLVMIGCILFVLALFSLFLWKRSQRIFHIRYENIISQLKKEEKNNNQSHISVLGDISDCPNTINAAPDKNLNIHDSTINIILNKLNKFEKSEKFLKKEISLTSLASSLDTNPRYLSEIIKQYKEKNFNNYLNGLRIQYITQLLYKEPIYREYKITYLAEYCGFASREVFAIAFKKETGVTPSYFISQLRGD